MFIIEYINFDKYKMGCGGQANRQLFDQTITVHGDIFNADTRSVLSILKIGNCKFTHKQIAMNTLENANAFGAEPRDPVLSLMDHTPMIELGNGKKIFGNAYEVIIYCCLQDLRNTDENGKPIKPKKNGP